MADIKIIKEHNRTSDEIKIIIDRYINKIRGSFEIDISTLELPE